MADSQNQSDWMSDALTDVSLDELAPPQPYGESVPADGSQGPLQHAPPRPVAADIITTKDDLPRIPCTEGPCRHFVEIAQVQGVVEGVEHRRLYRFCRLVDEEFGTMRVDELVLRGCTAFDPPTLSPRGWLQKINSSTYHIAAGRRHHYDIPVQVRLLGLAHTVLRAASKATRINVRLSPSATEIIEASLGASKR